MLTTQRYLHGLAQAGNYLYAVGGYGAPGPLNTVDRAQILADGSLGAWQILTSTLATARYHTAAVAYGGYLYVAGGFDIDLNDLSSVEMARVNPDGSLDPWQAASALVTARRGLGLVTYGGYLYAIGGRNTNAQPQVLSSVERARVNADGSLGAWSVVGNMGTGRWQFGLVAVGGYLYAIGGANPDYDKLSSVEMAKVNPDGSLGPWQPNSPMASAREALGAVAGGGYLYAIGGMNPANEILSSVERAAIFPGGSLGTWEATSSLTGPRHNMGAVATEDCIYVAGGSAGQQLTVEYARLRPLPTPVPPTPVPPTPVPPTPVPPTPVPYTLATGTWSEIQPAGTRPPARSGHTAVYDSANERMIVFGGAAAANFNDVWALSFSGTPTWTQLFPAGTAPPARNGHTAIYDSSRQRMIIFGGRAGGTYLNDVWALSLSGTPTWTQLFPAGAAPTTRTGHTAIYDSTNQRMVVFGGVGNGWMNDVWSMSLGSTPEWSQVFPAGVAPAGRFQHTAIYDSFNQRMVIFGGAYVSVELNDVYALSLSTTPTWSQILPAGVPPQVREGHTAVYDAGSQRMLVFAGLSSTTRLADVWALSLSGGSSTWFLVTPGGPVPAARQQHASVYDARNQRVVAFGGEGSSGPLVEVWSLGLGGPSPPTAPIPTWSQLFPGGSGPEGSGNGAVYDQPAGRMVLLVGAPGGVRTPTVWTLDLTGTPTWAQLLPAGAGPPPRYGVSTIYDGANRRMIVFAGQSGSEYFNDVWALSLSGTPTWSRLYPGGPAPSARSLHTAIYDGANQRMIAFGGTTATGASNLNDVWALSLSGVPAWTQLFPAGSAPQARYGHAAIYDGATQRMIVFGGQWGGGTFDEIWALSLSGTPTWSRVYPAGPRPAARAGHSAIYDSGNGRMVVFGGYGQPGTFNDVWALSLDSTPTWSRVEPAGAPPRVRSSHTAVYDEGNRRMVAYDGVTEVGWDWYLLDLWALSLPVSASPTPTPTATPSPTSTPIPGIPTATPTATPTPTPTPTPTVLPGPTPVVQGIEPNTGANTSLTFVTIRGANFRSGAQTALARAGSTYPLTDVTLSSSTTILAQVPTSLPAGVYDVVVTNSDGASGRLPAAYTVTSLAPVPISLVPAQGANDVPNDLTIDGYNFNQGVTTDLQKDGSSQALSNVVRVSSTRVQAVVPAGVEPGVYDVALRNAGASDAGRLPQAYTVLSSANDDLFVGTDDLWTNPTTVRKNDTVQLGLNLHRRGGKTTIQVPVRFYLGQPGAAGIPIGEVTSDPIVPQTVEKDPNPVYITWEVGSREGAAAIYAVVDPGNTITESTKLNNQASRSLTILPAAADATAPEVTNLVLNGGASETTDAALSVALTASDNPGGSGVATMYLVEKEFNSAARSWVSIQRTGWITYASSYSLTLTDRAGLRYIQAWVADGAGNMSLSAFKRQINYVPPTDSLKANQVRLYRRTLRTGDSLSVRVEPSSGDADLYVWGPTGNRVLVKNASGSAVDEGSFTATEAGVYQIEVFAYSDTTYRITFTGGQAAELAVASTAAPPVQLNAEKEARTAPIIAANDEPEGRAAIPMAPIASSGYSTYLPFLSRSFASGW